MKHMVFRYFQLIFNNKITFNKAFPSKHSQTIHLIGLMNFKTQANILGLQVPIPQMF